MGEEGWPGGKETRAVGGEKGRRRMERTRAEHVKSRIDRDGWGSREREKESVSAGSRPLLAPLAGSCS